MMDVSVLANPLFILVCVANVLGFLALYVPYVYLPNTMESKVREALNALRMAVIHKHWQFSMKNN